MIMVLVIRQIIPPFKQLEAEEERTAIVVDGVCAARTTVSNGCVTISFRTFVTKNGPWNNHELGKIIMRHAIRLTNIKQVFFELSF